MRLKVLVALLCAIMGLSAAATGRAEAFGWHRDRPDGGGKVRTINHHVYYPRYRHVYRVDPYAYRYSPRGYYPYYNAGYWRPAYKVRKRAYLHYYKWNSRPPRFRYHASWGSPKRCYHHCKWHAKHHGKIRRHHW